jgi:hypothetical protein
MSGCGYFDGPISFIGGRSDEATVLALVTGRECMEKKSEDSSPVFDMVARIIRNRRKSSGQDPKSAIQVETIVRIEMWLIRYSTSY